jgi:hypothetical protein
MGALIMAGDVPVYEPLGAVCRRRVRRLDERNADPGVCGPRTATARDASSGATNAVVLDGTPI